MVRLTLQRKFFVALALLLALLLAVFVGFTRLGLQRGLGDKHKSMIVRAVSTCARGTSRMKSET